MSTLSPGYIKQIIPKRHGQEGSFQSVIADSPIGGHRVVRYKAGLLIYADKDESLDPASVIGLTLNAASAGFAVNLMLQGFVEESSWSWTPDAPVYLGNNGLMTQVLPTTGFVNIVAFAVSATKIYFDVQMPIVLEV